MLRRSFVSLLCLLMFAATGGAQGFDVLIRGGRVLDGSGNPWFYQDIGVRDGRIVAVGDLGEAEASRVIDASGLYVMPGIIDIHSHANGDFNQEEPQARATNNNLTQGITTVAFSEGSVWEIDGRIQDKIGQWTDTGIGSNAVLFVGISQARREAMADPTKTPTEAEMNEMRRLIREAMEGGAFGIGVALDYWRAHWFTTDEIIELAKELVPFGGIYASHIRSEGTRSLWWVESDPSPRVTHKVLTRPGSTE